MDNKVIGRHIREARLDKKLTQYQLAERVHIKSYWQAYS